MTIKTLANLAARLVAAGERQKGLASLGLTVYCCSEPTAFEAMVYEPTVCLIVQGAKQTSVGNQGVTLGQGQCVVIGHHLPVLSRITEASLRKPYLSLIAALDLDMLSTFDDLLGGFKHQTETPRSLQVAPVSASLFDVFGRYLALADDAVEAKALLPLVRRELHFRLLRSQPGAMLRALAHRDSHASHISRAIRQLREHYREALDVTQLAKSVGMSASLFHREFKSMTGTTPLQYQKDLRLTHARHLLRTAGVGVSTAAFEVGYESPSQFSREYSRKFGASPRADLRAAQAA